MHLAFYKRLCKTCDSILLAHAVNHPDVLSISSLHVLNGHPSHIARYQGSVPSQFTSIFKFFVSRLYKIILGVSHCFQRPLSSKELNPEVVVFSHLLKTEHLKDSSDFYFGNLHHFLLSFGKRTLFVLFNHTGKPELHIWSDPQANISFRLPVLKNLNSLDEIRISLSQLLLFLRFRRSPNSSQIQAVPNLIHEILSARTSSNLRFYQQIHSLLLNLRPSSVIVTYEGHGWERLAFYAARNANPNVTCIGYQHAIIFPMQHSIQRSLGCQFDPDVVLFAGKSGRDWFLNHTNFSPKLDVVGTPRYTKLATNVSAKINSLRSKPACLLLPDGTMSESRVIFRFGLLCAKHFKNITFTIRFHPLISYELLLANDPTFRDLPVNFVLSKQPIDNDFAQSLWAVYRGSGAGIRAAMSGLRPIYYNDLSLGMRIDSLHMLSAWRRDVFSVESLSDIFHDDLLPNSNTFNSEYLSVRSQLDTLFSPFTPMKFLDYI